MSPLVQMEFQVGDSVEVYRDDEEDWFKGCHRVGEAKGLEFYFTPLLQRTPLLVLLGLSSQTTLSPRRYTAEMSEENKALSPPLADAAEAAEAEKAAALVQNKVRREKKTRTLSALRFTPSPPLRQACQLTRSPHSARPSLSLSPPPPPSTRFSRLLFR